MDLDCVSATPGGRWMGETTARRRQRRLSSPSLRAYLTPAFDAVAGGEGGIPGSSSSGGLDLGFDASLLRFRRAYLSASTDLDGRLLFHSPQSPPARAVYPAAEDELLVAPGGRYGFKLQASGMTGAPGHQDFKDCSSFISPWRPTADLPIAAAQGASNSIKLPADLRPPEDDTIIATKAELATLEHEAKATPSAQAASAHPEPAKEDDDFITEFLYVHRGRRRLPIFREICPE